MSCNTLTGGIDKSCGGIKGGIQKLYLTNFANVTSYTDTSATSTIASIVMNGGATFHEFAFNRNTSSFTEAMTGDEATGVQYMLQTITCVLAKREQAKLNKIKLLFGYEPLVIIGKDANGKHWLFGRVSGCRMTANEGGSGVAAGDQNGYTLTFVGEELEMAPEIETSAVTAVI